MPATKTEMFIDALNEAMEGEREACRNAVAALHSDPGPEGPGSTEEEAYGTAIADAVNAIRARESAAVPR